MTDNNLAVIAGRRDEDVAAELKVKLRAKLEEVCAVCSEARRAGFVPQFQFGLDPGNRDVIQTIVLAKFY